MCSTCDLAGPSQYVLSIYYTRRQAGVIVRSEVNLDVEYIIHTVHSNETRESHSTIYTRAWTGRYDFQWGPPDHETGLWSSGRAPVFTMTLVHEFQMWSLRCKHINSRCSMGLNRVPMDYDHPYRWKYFAVYSVPLICAHLFKIEFSACRLWHLSGSFHRLWITVQSQWHWIVLGIVLELSWLYFQGNTYYRLS